MDSKGRFSWRPDWLAWSIVANYLVWRLAAWVHGPMAGEIGPPLAVVSYVVAIVAVPLSFVYLVLARRSSGRWRPVPLVLAVVAAGVVYLEELRSRLY